MFTIHWTARDESVRECGLRKRTSLVLGFWWYGSLCVSGRISWRASQNEKREWNEIEPHNSLRDEKSADASGEAEGPPLLVPIKRQPRVVHELSCCELRRLVAVEDRADNIGGQ